MPELILKKLAVHVVSLLNISMDPLSSLLLKTIKVKKKVKQSLHTPWRRLGGKEV
jgi:hypothetical protein